MESLDRLLGTGVVYASENGSLRLDDEALATQLHRRPTREEPWPCRCPRCKAGAPKRAAKAPRQPWELDTELAQAA